MKRRKTTIAPHLNPKRRGELAEAAFLHKASGLGFVVAKPWGDSDPYDFIIAWGGRLIRVQVKSAYSANENGGYTFYAHGARQSRPYTACDVDFLVAYIVPEDLWYILPIQVFAGIGGTKISPRSSRRSRYEKYREAWSLMTTPM